MATLFRDGIPLSVDLPASDGEGIRGTTQYTTELPDLDEDQWHPSIFNSDAETANQQAPRTRWTSSSPRMFDDPDKGMFVAPPV